MTNPWYMDSKDQNRQSGLEKSQALPQEEGNINTFIPSSLSNYQLSSLPQDQVVAPLGTDSTTTSWNNLDGNSVNTNAATTGAETLEPLAKSSGENTNAPFSDFVLGGERVVWDKQMRRSRVFKRREWVVPAEIN